MAMAPRRDAMGVKLYFVEMLTINITVLNAGSEFSSGLNDRATHGCKNA